MIRKQQPITPAFFAQVLCDEQPCILTAVFKGDRREDAVEWCRKAWKDANKPYLAIVRDVNNVKVFRYQK